MTKHFADLGIAFPLFEAPMSEAAEYSGPGTCALCGSEARHTFSLGIGAYIMVRCSGCAAPTALSPVTRSPQPCSLCARTVRWPPFPDSDLKSCFTCLREGRAFLTKDTEFGMVSWEQAVSGVTHGLPGGLPRSDFEPIVLEGGWVGARIPRTHLTELLRTPTYLSIQGDRWLFCCLTPMTYVGSWSREDFIARAKDGDGEALFSSIVEGVAPGPWLEHLHDDTGTYVFHCRSCGRQRAHWDIA